MNPLDGFLRSILGQDEISPYKENTGQTPPFVPEQSNSSKQDNIVQPLDDSVVSGYQDLLNNRPREEDYKPRTRDKIVGSLTSALSAFGDNGSVEDAVKVGKGITEGPYKKAMTDWDSQVNATKPLLNTSVQMNRVSATKERTLKQLEENHARSDRAAKELELKAKDLERKKGDSRAIQNLRQQSLEQRRQAEHARNLIAQERNRISESLGNQRIDQGWDRLDQGDQKLDQGDQSLDLRNRGFDRKLGFDDEDKKKERANRKAQGRLFDLNPSLFDNTGHIRADDSRKLPAQIEAEQLMNKILNEEYQKEGIER